MGDSNADAAAGENGGSSAAASGEDTLVQYLVLVKLKGFSTGALIAQGAHAAVAASWESRESATTQRYLAPGQLQRMHKVTLEAPSREVLESVAASLSSARVPHHLWLELPENVPTALATDPLPRSVLKPFFAALKLLR